MDLFTRTAQIASDWLQSLDKRPVAESATVDELRSTLGGPLPRSPVDPLVVVEDLARASSRDWSRCPRAATSGS